MEELVEFNCGMPQDVDCSSVVEMLPKKKTRIVEAKTIEDLLHLTLLTKCTSVDEVKAWVNEFEEITKTTYSITVTKDTMGRYVNFKQYLHCQHNTRTKKSNDISRLTKNTNCPSRLKITLHAVKKRYQGKDRERYNLLKEMPCEIVLVLTHNHDIDTPDVLRFRKVSSDVKEKLMELFRSGHSPATAREHMMDEIKLNNEDYKSILADRKYFPSYNYCWQLYVKEFKNPQDRVVLQTKINEYNLRFKSNCAQVVCQGSEFVICICPPLVERVHRYCSAASEVVFVESSGSIWEEGSRIIMLWTDSECGCLPLGIIIVSYQSVDIIKLAFELLQSMLGGIIFYGNPEGPKMFVIGMSDTNIEQNAISAVWPKSNCFLCIYHVLQEVWRWLIKPENKIPEDTRYIFFKDFKSIMYSKSVDECSEQYKLAKINAANHENYCVYLEQYWDIRKVWALAFREDLLVKSNPTNDLFEAVMCIVKNQTFKPLMSLNLLQRIDYFLTTFINYHEERLLNIGDCKNVISNTIKVPTDEILEQICILANNEILVPSETTESHFYIVNIDALMCTCENNSGNKCKHIDWVCILIVSRQYDAAMNNSNLRKKYSCIAKGCESEFEPLHSLSDTATNPDLLKITYPNIEIKQEHNNNENLDSDKGILERTEEVLARLNSICSEYVEKSPINVLIALENGVRNLEELQSTSQFILAFANIGVEQRRRKRSWHVPYSRDKQANGQPKRH